VAVAVANLDVEGGELEILESLNFTICTPPIIIIEIHGSDAKTVLNLTEAALLISNDYRLVAITVITAFFVREIDIPND